MEDGLSGWLDCVDKYNTITLDRIMSLETADSNFHFRVRAEDKNLVDRAAEIVGSSRSQFVMSAAIEKAKDVLLDQSIIHMNSRDFDAVLKWLDGPKSPEELDGVKRLMSLRAPWE
jgi:uncharacterized protein (DUF1778 family)